MEATHWVSALSGLHEVMGGKVGTRGRDSARQLMGTEVRLFPCSRHIVATLLRAAFREKEGSRTEAGVLDSVMHRAEESGNEGGWFWGLSAGK